MFTRAERRTLANGLKVLLCPNPRVPLACVLTWVRAGYFDEPDELAGVSHYIEHLFYKGTPTRPVGSIAKETQSIGGYLNAATIYDHTYFYTVVPSRNLIPALDIQSDALLHPLFDEEEMQKEKGVIVQELKRKYDNPGPYALEKLLELAFEKHRMRRWRMGTEEQIRGYPREAVIDYYRRFYVSQNTTLVVTGDFDIDKIVPEIEVRYGQMESKGIEREALMPEPVQETPRMLRLVGDISQALVKVGFHAPEVTNPDFYAMSALAILMGRGRSSRLFRMLKEEKGLVDGIGQMLFDLRDVGFFAIEAELKPESMAAFEEELWVEIDRLRRDPPTPQEVSKVRNIVERQFLAAKEDVLGQAHALAYFEDLGSYELALDHVNRMRSVTAEDLVRVAQKYLQFSNMSLVEYVPERIGEGAATEGRLASLQKRVQGRIEQAGGTVVPDPTPPAAPMVLDSGARDPAGKVEVIRLNSGRTLLYCRNPFLPLVSVAVYFPGGRLEETSENCGLTQFLLRTSIKGTESRSAEEIAFETESLGTSIHFEAGADLFGYSMSILARDFDRGMSLLSDVIVNPRFPSEEVEKERTAALAELSRTRDNMFIYPIELFYKALYGVHPYGLPRNGTDGTVSSFAQNQLEAWHSESIPWREMIVSVVGDLDRAQAIQTVETCFAISEDRDREPCAQLYPVVPARGIQEESETRRRQQTGMVLGFRGVSQKDERFYALEVLRNVVAGMGGRLFRVLRDQHALAYTVTAFNVALLRSGVFFTYIATSPKDEGEARKRLTAELMRLREDRVTEAELRMSKVFCQGSHAIALQKNQTTAYAYVHHKIIGRGVEEVELHDRRIEEVTAEQVRSVARDVFDAEQCAMGIVRGRNG